MLGGRDRPPGGPGGPGEWEVHEVASRLFKGISFAGPLRRAIPAISRTAFRSLRLFFALRERSLAVDF